MPRSCAASSLGTSCSRKNWARRRCMYLTRPSTPSEYDGSPSLAAAGKDGRQRYGNSSAAILLLLLLLQAKTESAMVHSHRVCHCTVGSKPQGCPASTSRPCWLTAPAPLPGCSASTCRTRAPSASFNTLPATTMPPRTSLGRNAARVASSDRSTAVAWEPTSTACRELMAATNTTFVRTSLLCSRGVTNALLYSTHHGTHQRQQQHCHLLRHSTESGPLELSCASTASAAHLNIVGRSTNMLHTLQRPLGIVPDKGSSLATTTRASQLRFKLRPIASARGSQ